MIVAQITENGVIAPPYSEILSDLQSQFKEIYGQDIDLDADTADGQWIAIIASALNDANAQIVASHAGYSPSTASGATLSSVVKTNGIARYIATKSTVDLRIIGQAGTTIRGGIVEDINSYRWLLPETVVIPPQGEITETATCQTDGSIPAEPNTVTRIITPTLGWQSVTNPDSASEGAPVETDAQLRRRQTLSVALPSRSVFDGILAGVAAIDGVTALSGIDNDTGQTDENGVPGHSIAIIADGGDAQTIGETIFLKKGPGTGTYGTTTITVKDSYGIPHDIGFSRPTIINVNVKITLQALSGYETDIGNQIKQTVADYINNLAIGESVSYTRLYLPASLCGTNLIQYYKLIAVEIAKEGGTVAAADIPIAFNETAETTIDNVEIVVQS